MPLSPEEYKQKTEEQKPDFSSAVEMYGKLLEDEELVPYGSAVRSYLETLTKELDFLQKGEYTDFGLQLSLNNLAELKEQLNEKDRFTDEPVKKSLKELFNKQKVCKPQECYDELRKVDEYFGLGLDVPELQLGTEGAAKQKAAEEKKKAAEEKKKLDEEKRQEKAREAEKNKPSWLKYVELHRPKAGKTYSLKEKKELLAKMMVAANVHASNVNNPDDPKPFDLSAARKLSSKLMDKWAFKHRTRDGYYIDELLNKEPADLAAVVQDIRRPFAGMSLEDRKNKIKELKGMLQYMDPKEGRSDKYKKMYESIEGVTEEQLNSLQDCDDPKKNGEELLQNIFDSTEKYQKGKKSLRSKPDQACRFDQSVDILACLGNSTAAAKNMAEGLIERINDVRTGHGQPTYISFYCGEKEHFKEHSNQYRLYQKQMELYKAQKRAGLQNLTEPKDPFAEPPKPRNILAKNENATMLDLKTYKDSPESLNTFQGDSGDFTDSPEKYTFYWWQHYKDQEMPLDQAKESIAGALAAKETPLLYSAAWKKVGCDGNVFKANYQQYINDPNVEELAKKLQDPEERKKLFEEGKEITAENLKAEALDAEYQKIAQPAPELL